MSRVSFDSPDRGVVHCDCPRECGNDEVEVQWDGNADVYTPELSCAACDLDVQSGRVQRPALPDGQTYATPSWNFTAEEIAILVDRAKHTMDNYCPSDSELRAAGLLE